MPAEIVFTEEIQQRICDLLADYPMYKICKMDGMPSNSTVLKWYALYPDFHERCRRARDLSADNALDEHNQIMDDLRTGVIEPDAARVLLNGLQWRIMQLDKARYGDKPSNLTITNQTDNRRVDITFESLKLAGKDVLDAAKRQITQALEANTDNDEK